MFQHMVNQIQSLPFLPHFFPHIIFFNVSVIISLALLQRVSNMTVTKRRGVQDLVTVVTMRMTKYLTLIEAIIKNTKGM